jgi:hypothetical protein
VWAEMMQALDPALLCVIASLRDYANVLSWSQGSGRLGPHTASGDVLRATFTPEALLAAGLHPRCLCCRLALAHSHVSLTLPHLSSSCMWQDCQRCEPPQRNNAVEEQIQQRGPALTSGGLCCGIASVSLSRSAPCCTRRTQCDITCNVTSGLLFLSCSSGTALCCNGCAHPIHSRGCKLSTSGATQASFWTK